MALPIKALPTADVVIEGATVTVRGLSRAEAMKFTAGFTEEAMPGVPMAARADAAEVWLLVHGAGVDETEAVEWRNATDLTTVGLLVDKIVELSALGQIGGTSPQASSNGA